MNPPKYTWDAKAGRYRSAGRFVSQKKVQALADAYIQAKQGKTADAMFELLRSGATNVKDIQLLGEREIAKAHLAQAMAAKGGRLQMSSADFGRVGSLVKPQLKYFRDRMKAIAEGQPLDGRVKQSFRAFIAASRETFVTVDRMEAERRGWDLEGNDLDDGARHCDECPSLTGKWFDIGTMPPPGQRECRHHCRCGVIYKNSITGEIRE